jgi:hypothetical protein
VSARQERDHNAIRDTLLHPAANGTFHPIHCLALLILYFILCCSFLPLGSIADITVQLLEIILTATMFGTLGGAEYAGIIFLMIAAYVRFNTFPRNQITSLASSSCSGPAFLSLLVSVGFLFILFAQLLSRGMNSLLLYFGWYQLIDLFLCLFKSCAHVAWV